MVTRNQLNQSVAQEAEGLLVLFHVDGNAHHPSLTQEWDNQSVLRSSYQLNGAITSNFSFMFRLVNRLVNHEVGLPNIDDPNAPNIHWSQRETWTPADLQAAYDALPDVVVAIARFMGAWRQGHP